MKLSPTVKTELATLLRSAALDIEQDNYDLARARITEFLGKVAGLGGAFVTAVDPADVAASLAAGLAKKLFKR